jgi:hypothetical protein
MAYPLSFSIGLGINKAAIADLNAQLVDTAGSNVGAAIATGFVNIGSGFYLWYTAAIPAAHRGGVKFYSAAAPTVVLAFCAVNPEEAEYVDAAVSSRLATVGYTAPPSMITAQAVRDALKLDASAGAPATGSIDKHVDDVLTNVALIPTNPYTGTPPAASTIASQVRTELTTELGRIDAAVSTRSVLAAGAKMDIVDAPNSTALVAIATAVWAATTRTLTAFGTLAADTAAATYATVSAILAGINNKLDASTVNVVATIVGSTINVYRDATWSIDITALGAIAADDVVYFSVKRNAGDSDADALVRISRAGGLVWLNKAATTNGNGTLTVTNATTGALTVTLKPAASATFDAMTGLAWDIKRITAAGVASELTAGVLNILPTVTRAIA